LTGLFIPDGMGIASLYAEVWIERNDMNKEYARREKTDFVKLIVISLITIMLYLAFSFESVYGLF
jgi:hypothetical protein